MTIAHVHRVTFKQINCTVKIKQDKITRNEKVKQHWSFVCWNRT